MDRSLELFFIVLIYILAHERPANVILTCGMGFSARPTYTETGTAHDSPTSTSKVVLFLSLLP